MNISDAQVKLYNNHEREFERELESLISKFQDEVIELAEVEVNHQPLFDRLADESVGWNGFPNNCTIALVDEHGKVFPIPRTQLNEIFNLEK